MVRQQLPIHPADIARFFCRVMAIARKVPNLLVVALSRRFMQFVFVGLD
jgi:hypothetical protein